jgi:isopenicillin N synthase-like dioxygenase
MVSAASTLPVIDISSSSPDTAKELVKAISEYGFVYIKSNVIPNKDINEMFGLVGVATRTRDMHDWILTLS